MKTEAEVQVQVLSAVFADRNRSLEGAIERAVRAGIEFERARIKSILALSAPPGLERAIQVLAVQAGGTPENVTDFIANCRIGPEHVAEFRKMFRLVDNKTKIEESDNVG